GSDVDDGPTIQAPPDHEAMMGSAMPNARAAMIAAMVAEEAAAATGGVPSMVDNDLDDQDDTIVQTTRVEPAQNRAAPPRPAPGRAPAPLPAAGKPAPAPAAGKPADALSRRADPLAMTAPLPTDTAYLPRPQPAGRSNSGLTPQPPPGLPPPPIMQ